jgi:outer membrane lipopolysaccharide assembly protein LptE/RlpB
MLPCSLFTSVLQACGFDLLDGNMFDADRNVVTLKTSSGHQIFNLRVEQKHELQLGSKLGVAVNYI